MDPNACLARIMLAACGNGARVAMTREAIARARKEYAEACQDLAEWLSRGGFKPTIPANMRYIPGTGTRWQVLSPTPDIDPDSSLYTRVWTLALYDYKGNRAGSWELED